MNGMPITMLNGFSLGCHECGGSCGFGDVGETYHVGDTVLARKMINTYAEPNVKAKVLRTIKPDGYVGKIAEGRAAGWLKISTGAWIINNPENIYKVKFDHTNAPPLTDEQKIEILKSVAKGNPITAGQVVVVDAAMKTVQGAGELVEGAFDTIGFIGKNLKWIALAILAVGGYVAYNKFQAVTK